MPEINWYPGHMAKTKKILETQIRSVDAVIELCDARAPKATRNPDLVRLTGGKTRILILNKADLASDAATAQWLAYYKKYGVTALKYQSVGGRAKEIFRFIENAARPAVERMKARGANKTVRVMVVGIPNVGKSTFINHLRGAAVAKTSDRPGVTRSNQWVKITPYLELLDTPGMLWPKLEDQGSARVLAFLGSIRDQIMDGEELATQLLETLLRIAPAQTRARYKLPEDAAGRLPEELLELVGLDPKRTLDSYPHELSGGQRQRVLIAMALTRDPQLVICDEPTTALDETVQKQVIKLLNRLQEELGFAMVFVSHDLALVAEVANSITVMYAGQVVEQGPVRDIMTEPIHEYTRGLLGSVLSIEAGGARLHQVPGSVPSPKDFPEGDRFRPRSSHPDKTSNVRPMLKRVANSDHYYAELPDSELKRLGIKPYLPEGVLL